MIFVTIGSMFPFDRLVGAMDAWAEAHPGTEILAQIGAAETTPAHMRWVRRLDQTAFSRTVAEATLVVAHAGMGSVMTASQHARPIVMLPRLSARGEHTTDHQIATANWLRGKPGVYIADAEADLDACIAAALADGPPAAPTFAPEASGAFIARLRQCIIGGA